MNTAVFVEFEDLFRALRQRGDFTDLRSREAALGILQGLLERLRAEGHSMVVGRSFAAFDTYPGVEVAHDLALLGLDPQYVLVSHSGRSSADVQLTFDVARVLFRRADIELIVVVSGDRDFLPLARQVLEEGRDLRVVSISETTSGDLRARVGSDRFWDALGLLAAPAVPAVPVAPAVPAVPTVPVAPAESEDPLTMPEPGLPEVDVEVVEPSRAASELVPEVVRATSDEGAAQAVVVGHIPVTWSGPASAEEQEERLRICLELMMRSRLRHGSREVWLSPFLKGPMSQHFAHVVHPERRALINALRDRGVIRVEERENQFADHPYSVIVIEDDHTLAREVAVRLRQA